MSFTYVLEAFLFPKYPGCTYLFHPGLQVVTSLDELPAAGSTAPACERRQVAGQAH